MSIIETKQLDAESPDHVAVDDDGSLNTPREVLAERLRTPDGQHGVGFSFVAELSRTELIMPYLCMAGVAPLEVVVVDVANGRETVRPLLGSQDALQFELDDLSADAPRWTCVQVNMDEWSLSVSRLDKKVVLFEIRANAVEAVFSGAIATIWGANRAEVPGSIHGGLLSAAARLTRDQNHSLIRILWKSGLQGSAELSAA